MCRLLLSRKLDQSVIIGSGKNEVEVKIIGVSGGNVRLMIQAPAEIPVHRKEVARSQLETTGEVKSLAGRHVKTAQLNSPKTTALLGMLHIGDDVPLWVNSTEVVIANPVSGTSRHLTWDGTTWKIALE